MVEARSSPSSPRGPQSPSSSESAEALIAAAEQQFSSLAALIAAAEQLTADLDEDVPVCTAPEMRELAQSNGMAEPVLKQLDVQHHGRQVPSLLAGLHQAVMPQTQDIFPVKCVPVSSHTVSYRCDPVGRHMQNSKLRHVWMLRLAGEVRDMKVELIHSRSTGKKQVLVDGKVMFSTREKSLNWSWEHLPSNARIILRSENGSHQLLCHDFEREQAPAQEHLASNARHARASNGGQCSPRSPEIKPRSSPASSATTCSPQSPAPLSSPQMQPPLAEQGGTVTELGDDEVAEASGKHGLLHQSPREAWQGGPGMRPAAGLGDDKGGSWPVGVLGDDDSANTCGDACRGCASNAVTAGSETVAVFESLVVRDDQNRRLQELIQHRDTQIATLEGQLKCHEPEEQDELDVTRHPEECLSLEHDELDVTRHPEECLTLEHDELDVTRHLGLAHELPQECMQAGCVPTVNATGPAELCKQTPVIVEVKVKVEQMRALPHARAGSTPPALQNFRAHPQDVGQSHRPCLPSQAHAQAAAQRHMPPQHIAGARRVAIRHHCARSRGRVGPARSKTPGPWVVHGAACSGNRPEPLSAPRLLSQPPGVGSMCLPSKCDSNSRSHGESGGVSSQAVLPQARQRGPSRGRPTIGRSLKPDPGPVAQLGGVGGPVLSSHTFESGSLEPAASGMRVALVHGHAGFASAGVTPGNLAAAVATAANGAGRSGCGAMGHAGGMQAVSTHAMPRATW